MKQWGQGTKESVRAQLSSAQPKEKSPGAF